jgi:hypothetical protein
MSDRRRAAALKQALRPLRFLAPIAIQFYRLFAFLKKTFYLTALSLKLINHGKFV